jgi:hypothetical protein
MEKERFLSYSVTFALSKKLEEMKEVTSKSLFLEFMTNPIGRNLAIIFIGGLLTAITLVTAGVMLLLDHW